MWPRYMDQVTGLEKLIVGPETWSLNEKQAWTCFRGPRFAVSLMVCDGKLEEVCAEAQALRDSCPRAPHTPGFHICWQPRQLVDQEPTIRRREDGTVRFALLWVVTNGERVLGEFYRETRPEEEPLVSFSEALREWVEENLEERPCPTST